MPLQIMKLLVNVEANMTLGPTVNRFFFVTTTDTNAEETLTIDAAEFFDDTGTAPLVLPDLNADNSHYKIYINGVPQMDGISVYTPGEPGVGTLTITVPVDNAPILAGTPIVLEVVNYEPSSTVDVAT